MSIRRLAIVNRGEPAMRVLAAVAELNGSRASEPITTIAVYTDPDAQAWYVRAADEALPLGPATYVDPADGTRRSRYLDEPAVIAALRAASVDAVWVGWGFLAESASFARSCEDAGITFVGPDSSTILALGDKMAAKRLAESVNVPVVPWSGDAVDQPAGAAEHARRLGYPLLLKAAAGGGGRGMRVIRQRSQLAPALASARAEAALAFGDPRVFLEKLVPACRHVEVQIIADNHGTIWATGVRDCTIQRRHQKVIEESSSPALDRATERAIIDAATRIAAAAGYRNAGTVEFLVDPRSRQFSFMEVNTRLQVEHPVTEATTGLDLVKLQLYVADGGRLRGRPPARRGHAVEARLCAEDPENDFAPSPGRLAVLATPTGPGIRIDAGVREGDVVAPEFDSMIAKIVAWGRDRSEALARLRRALAGTSVVIEGGGTNRSFLLALLDRPEVRDARVDVEWLDRLTTAGAHLPAPDPVALLYAAVDAYETEQATDRAAFHARAARGLPEAPGEVGHACQLRYRGVRYHVRVYRTGPCTYRVNANGNLADVAVERLNAYECWVEVSGRRHRVVTVADGPTLRIEVDDTAHRVCRDDGDVVRSGWPAFVASVRVKPGDVVAAGDPLLVVESMKMEARITAPYGGEVASVEVCANEQIDAGAPLLRLRPHGEVASGAAAALDLRGLTAPEAADRPPCQRVYSSLCGYLLGYDLDPATLRELLTRQRRLCEVAPPTDPGLMTCEDGLLDLFADVGWLYRPRTETEPDDPLAPGGTQEYLTSYLQWLDADRAGLPDHYRQRLRRALCRYGIQGLERSAELEEAVVWMYRSFRRVRELAPSVVAILERRLRHRDALADRADAPMRARLDRLATAAQGRYQLVADLAREVRFSFLDEPVLSKITRDEYSIVDSHLDALAADPGRADRAERLDRLVASPEPLRETLLRRWLSTCDEVIRCVLLEVYARRYYRIRTLRDLSCATWAGHLVCSAWYELDGRQIHLVIGYTPIAGLSAWSAAVAAHLAGDRPDDGVPAAPVGPDREIVVDLTAWREGEGPVGDPLVAELAELLGGCRFGRPLRRIDLTVSATTPGPTPNGRARHVTFRQAADGTFVEERLYRDMHPMLAKRLALWRLGNFDLVRMPSAEDVYLFHGVARDNAADHRLFALAEVRDLTPVAGPPDGSAPVSYPRLELMGMRALSAMRLALTQFSERDKPAANRIILEVRPPWTVPPQAWPGWARSLAPLAVGAGLEKVVLRVRIPEPAGTREAVLHVAGLGGHGVTVRERPVGHEMIRPLTRYRQKVLQAQRLGVPYPYELVQMLAPPVGAVGQFPTGTFTEYDLNDTGALVPVERLPGLNTANIVVGVIVNHTTKVPEGMSRVMVLGDPTTGLGNLAEPECRRIIAALDLAERLSVPMEWFALSSGARIAMDSGTENMDWIAAVLRRLVEYTQRGGEVNVVVTGVNVGAQPYWNAEATMLQHTRGILIMTPQSTMVLTGKQALDFSGGVSADDNLGIGGFDRVMGPNGQGQYWAPTVEDACAVLFAHYDHAYVVPGERYPRRAVTRDPADRDVRVAPHPDPDGELVVVGDVFSVKHNPDRKKPFDIRAIMRAVSDVDANPLERWTHWRGAETAVVWDAHIGGIPVCLLGVESRTMNRRGFVPADGPQRWNSGTLFPQSSRKLARAINAASDNRPLVVLANLSGFDGSPESMRHRQLEYGAEIGRAVTNFRGPIVFVVVSRYHGGAFVVFSKRLNERMEIAAVEGSFASVIGGAPAAATVFAREVTARTERDPRVRDLRDRTTAGAQDESVPGLRARLAEMTAAVRSEKLGELAAEFDRVHTIQRALAVGSVDRIIAARDLRPYLIDALERGMARDCASTVTTARGVPHRPRRSSRTRPAGR